MTKQVKRTLGDHFWGASTAILAGSQTFEAFNKLAVHVTENSEVGIGVGLISAVCIAIPSHMTASLGAANLRCKP